MRAGVLRLGVLGVAFTVASSAWGDPLDAWRTPPPARAVAPGGRRKNDDKERDKKKDPSDPKDPKAPPSASPPESLPPGLGGLGLPLGFPSLAPGLSGTPSVPGGAAAGGAAAGGTAAGGAAAGGAAAGGAAAGGAAAGGAAAGGAAAGGAAVGGATAGSAAAGATPVALAAATAKTLLAGVSLRADGGLVFAPGDAGAAAPKLRTALDAPARAGMCPKETVAVAAQGTAESLGGLARCYERAGASASAWLLFMAAKDAPAVAVAAREEAAQRSAALAPSLPRVTFEVREVPGAGPATVTLDGVAMPRAYWNRPLPIDPGAHVVAVRMGDGAPVEQRFDATPGPQPAVVRYVPEKPARSRALAVWTGGATLVLTAATVAAGLWTLDARDAFHAKNGTVGTSASELDDLRSTARTRGIVTTGLGAAAGLGLALTTVFWLTGGGGDPAKVRVSGWIDGSSGGLGVGGGL